MLNPFLNRNPASSVSMNQSVFSSCSLPLRNQSQPSPPFSSLNENLINSSFLKSQAQHVLVFKLRLSEDFKEGLVIRPLKLQLKRADEVPNVEITINSKEKLLVSDEIIILASRLIKFEKRSTEFKIAHINLDFPSAFIEMVFFIYYGDVYKLVSSINSFESLVQIYAASKILHVNNKLNIKKILLTILKENSDVLVNFSDIPAVLNKQFVDLDFLIEILNTIVEKGNGKSCEILRKNKLILAMEWLSDKNSEDKSKFESSEEFKMIGDRLSSEKLLLKRIEDYREIAEKYPNEIACLNIKHILSGLDL